jgi:hypothetical protein
MNKSDSKALVSPTPSRWLGRELSTAIVLVHEAVAARLGLSATRWRCWGLLDQHGPATAGRLERGYAGRTRHPRDRPSVIIHPLRMQRPRHLIWPIFASPSGAMDQLAPAHTSSAYPRNSPRFTTIYNRRGHARADRKALQHPPIGGASGVSRTWIFVACGSTR